MKRTYSFPLLFIVLCLSACDSNETATNSSTEKRLIVSPTQLDGDQYAVYEFKAKVTNVPLSDVALYWDFDEGEGFQKDNSQVVEHMFTELNMHTVRVKANDYFSGELLGSDSIHVNIHPPVLKFEIAPHLVDSILVLNSSGVAQQGLTFTVASVSTPKDRVIVTWDFADGTLPTEHSALDSVVHFFTSAGTFKVTAEARETSGLIIGKDSATIIVELPQVTSAHFANIKSISTYLVLDSVHPATKDPLFTNPLSVRFLKSNSWVETSFQLDNFNGLVYLDGEDFMFNDTLNGEFSPDYKSIRTLRIAVYDTGKFAFNTQIGVSGILKYTYVLHDLDLIAVAGTKIVYRSKLPVLSSFMSSLTFKAVNLFNSPRGFDTEIQKVGHHPVEEKEGPYGLVVFERP